MAMSLGKTDASCFFSCGVMFGARLLAIASNCALVMTVLHPAGAVLVAVAGLAAVPAAVFGGVSHTPSMVMTGALGGTEAEASFSASCACAFIAPAPAAGEGCGGGPPGAAWPQDSAPPKTHSSQLLRINSKPPGLVHQTLKKIPSRKS